MNIFFADAGLANGKCEVLTQHASADDVIDRVAAMGEATMFPTMVWMVLATMA
ncbi:hypothetical protein V1277_006530 [Bradyrhizobium sp. AZCC 1588]|uniref:hypothetical protein n=1 Tax=unclassified Bradyrhizobium TaxID=2631580 RepID=UPI002FEE7A15